MATVNIAFFKPRVQLGYSVIGPVRASESITSSGTSAQSNLTGDTNEVACITSTGNIHVLVGTNPTADANDLLVYAGIPCYIYVPAGETVAVIDAA